MSMNVTSIAFFPLRSAAVEETGRVGQKAPLAFEERRGAGGEEGPVTFEERGRVGKRAAAAFEERASVLDAPPSFEEATSAGEKFYI